MTIRWLKMVFAKAENPATPNAVYFHNKFSACGNYVIVRRSDVAKRTVTYAAIIRHDGAYLTPGFVKTERAAKAACETEGNR